MQFPDKISIERIEDYHTHYTGRTSDGRQFWGYVTFVYTVYPKDVKGDWKDYRNEYVIVHIFDKEGNHISTRHLLAGTSTQVTDIQLYSKLEDMVSELGEIKYGNIQAKIFTTLIDGVIFGLVPDETHGYVNLEPNSTIAFGPPWDGSYST